MISSPNQEVKEVLMRSKVFQQLAEQNKIFKKTQGALAAIGFSKEDIGQQRDVFFAKA